MFINLLTNTYHYVFLLYIGNIELVHDDLGVYVILCFFDVSHLNLWVMKGQKQEGISVWKDSEYGRRQTELESRNKGLKFAIWMLC